MLQHFDQRRADDGTCRVRAHRCNVGRFANPEAGTHRDIGNGRNLVEVTREIGRQAGVAAGNTRDRDRVDKSARRFAELRETRVRGCRSNELDNAEAFRFECIAQIGGLTIATFVSLLIIPVLYAICVEDLGIVKWEGADA